ncbi:hypothetical protein GCM10020331_058920 [Ectobacillus funiculus]
MFVEEENNFHTWIRKKLEQEGYIRDELEGKVKEQLLFVPKDLQKLAEEAKFREKKQGLLFIYISNLCVIQRIMYK